MAGGRPTDSVSKNKQFLLNRLQDEYGEDFHPIMKMAKNCSVLQKIADQHSENHITVGSEDNENEIINASTSAQVANAAWEKIAPYTEPKLKATEIKIDPESTLTTMVIAAQMDPDQAQEIYKKLCE